MLGKDNSVSLTPLHFYLSPSAVIITPPPTLSLSLSLYPPVLGFVRLHVQRQCWSRKKPLCFMAEGSVMIAAGFSSSEKLTEERHSKHLTHVYVGQASTGEGEGFWCLCTIVSQLLEERMRERCALNFPALLFAGMSCLSAVAGYYYLQPLPASFTRVFQSMAQSDRGGEDNRAG